MRLREIEPADRRTLTGFDRDSADGRMPQVGGHRHWAAHRSSAADAGDDDLRFAIETLHSGLLVGSMSASRADPRPDRFSYSIGIGPRHRRCGYAEDAITVLLTHMFGQRHYRRCEVGIYGGNLASLTLHAGLGFREEVRLPDTELSHGEIKYLVRMGVTADEFAGLHPDSTEPRPFGRPRRGRHWRTRRGQHWDTSR
ncbi:GNAT family N-acetyltransferase [Amycolatopsis sp. H20-H5]|nr:GNAT family N-acetyltransferase [Amycolatopsis sp. H20-H5]MEC3974209.1 GNAT family N-acetyltransferase [Amycolatopsis sp. H20-H5]